MSNSSLAKTWVEILFIGPLLSWRVIKMAVASAQVIGHRSSLVIKGPKNRQERKEFRTMIHEKFLGAGEASTAYFTSLNKNLPFTSTVSSSISAAIDAWRSLFDA